MSDLYHHVDRLFEWVKCRRTELGTLVSIIGAVLVLATTFYESRHLQFASAAITLVGGYFITAGKFKSDDYHRDKAELLKTQLDRRNTDSLIPVRDLKKLLDKDAPSEVLGPDPGEGK